MHPWPHFGSSNLLVTFGADSAPSPTLPPAQGLGGCRGRSRLSVAPRPQIPAPLKQPGCPGFLLRLLPREFSARRRRVPQGFGGARIFPKLAGDSPLGEDRRRPRLPSQILPASKWARVTFGLVLTFAFSRASARFCVAELFLSCIGKKSATQQQ